MDIELLTVDERKVFHENLLYDVVKTDTLGSKVNLYDYQVDVANFALEKKQGIIKCATGGGKTMIFTSILKAFGGRYPAMMICKNRSIVDQTYQTFKDLGLQDVGRVHMNYTEPNLITCITAQSLHKVEPLLNKTKILLLDEVHEWASKGSEKQINFFENATYKLGFSATPWNQDEIHNHKLKGLVGPELCDIGIDYLTEQNILSSCHAHFYRVSVPDPPNPTTKSLENISYLDSDNHGIVENEQLHLLVKQIVDSIPSGRILILVRRLPHGDRLRELIPNSFWIRGEDNASSREYVLQQLRKSESKKVVAIMSSIGFYGLNVLCHHLINACGGKDANMLIQKVGRGLRKGIDKDHLEYHDFIFEGDKFLNRHSKLRISILEKEGHQVTLDKKIPK